MPAQIFRLRNPFFRTLWHSKRRDATHQMANELEPHDLRLLQRGLQNGIHHCRCALPSARIGRQQNDEEANGYSFHRIALLAAPKQRGNALISGHIWTATAAQGLPRERTASRPRLAARSTAKGSLEYVCARGCVRAAASRGRLAVQ